MEIRNLIAAILTIPLAALGQLGSKSLMVNPNAGGTKGAITGPVTAAEFKAANSISAGVTLAGENYLSLAAQVITANPVNLAGTNVTGTLADARLSANVPLLNAANTWTNTNRFEPGAGFGSPASLDGVLEIYNENNAFYYSIQATGTPSANRVIYFPDISGTIALTTGAQTLTSKTIALGSNTITGTLAEFNAALTGADFATGGGTASGTNTGDQTITLTGDGTGTGTGSFALTLATVNGNVGTFGSATQASVVTVNAKGLVTAASNATVTPAVGSITGLGTGVATFLAYPISEDANFAVDDFDTGTNSAGSIGAFGWRLTTSGALTDVANAGTAFQGALSGHPGIYRVSSGATDNSSQGIVLAGSSQAPYYVESGLKFRIVFRVNATTSSAFFFGLANDFGHDIAGRYVGIRADTDNADTLFYAVCADNAAHGAPETKTSTGITFDTGWHVATITIGSGTADIQIDAGSVITLNTNFPTNRNVYLIGESIARATATLRTVDFDLIGKAITIAR